MWLCVYVYGRFLSTEEVVVAVRRLLGCLLVVGGCCSCPLWGLAARMCVPVGSACVRVSAYQCMVTVDRGNTKGINTHDDGVRQQKGAWILTAAQYSKKLLLLLRRQ